MLSAPHALTWVLSFEDFLKAVPPERQLWEPGAAFAIPGDKHAMVRQAKRYWCTAVT